ncbi:MAG TPA: acyloxyacyl hydrolase [Cyclobacteriaceae bacterium]|nr:acyloxyacyl hydrolase [Cyclobacteriaceae bacterium]
MIRLIVLLIFINCHASTAQDWFFNKSDIANDSLPQKSFFQFRYQAGGIANSNTVAVDESIGSNPFQSVDIRYGTFGYGRKKWHQLHHFPSYGIGMGKYFFQPADNITGNPVTAYIFFNESFLRFKKSAVSYDIAVGLAGNWKPYDPVTNPDQLVIGSPVTGLLSLNLNYDLQLSERVDAKIGVGLNHFSNGRIRSPNRGLNLYGMHATLVYTLGPSSTLKLSPVSRPTEPFTPFLEFDVVGSLGVVSTFQDKANPGIYYMTGSATLDVSRHYGYKGKYGIGLDWFYDESLKVDYQTQYPSGVPENLLYWPGVHLSHEYMIHRWTIITQAGLNLKQVGDKGTGFGRLAFRYDLSKSIFLRVGLRVYKSVVSDFIEWGVGYSLYPRKARVGR